MLSEYKLLKVLYQLGRTTVYLAQRRNDRVSNMVVLKKTSLGGASLENRRLATQEAQLLSRLKHPNIVKCLDYFEDDDAMCIVMEWAELGDLSSSWTRRGSMAEHSSAVMDVTIQLLLALRYLHGLHLIHRDVKTKNILTAPLLPGSRSLRVKLGDFGIARMTTKSSAMARTTIGTPFYSSPEIFSGDEYDSKADIWSLGCVVYEMVTGVRPFNGAEFRELSRRVRSCSYAALGKDVPYGLRDLIDSMLQPDPKLRSTALDLLGHPFVKEHSHRLFKELTAPREQFDVEFSQKFDQLKAKLGARAAAESFVMLMAPGLETDLARSGSEVEMTAVAHRAWKRRHETKSLPAYTFESTDRSSHADLADLTMTIQQHLR